MEVRDARESDLAVRPTNATSPAKRFSKPGREIVRGLPDRELGRAPVKPR